MKNIKKILLLLLTIVIFTAKVNAGVNINECFKVTENDIPTWNAGFDVRLPVCDWKRDGNNFNLVDIGGNKGKNESSPQAAYNAGAIEEDITYWVESADAKSYVKHKGKTSLCSDSNREVKGKIAAGECTISIPAKSQTNMKQRYERTNETSTNGRCSRGFYYNGGCYVGTGNYYCEGDTHSIGHDRKCCPNGYEEKGTACCPEGYSYKSATNTCEKEAGAGESSQKKISNISSSSSNDGNTLAEEIKKSLLPDIEGARITCNKSFKYDLYCPVYRCDEKIETYKACVPTFTADGAEAYCINPSQPFSEEGYKASSDFDFNSCRNSWENANCGYANILIEGAWQADAHKKLDPKKYINISNDSIYLALRLWAYHNKQSGFNKSGIANVAGDKCETRISFVKDSKNFENIYKRTYDTMYEMYFNKVSGSKSSITELTTSSLSFFDDVSCSKPSLACHISGGSVVKNAYALFFNTLFGNSKMLEHLKSLRGNGAGIVAKPTIAEPIDDDKDGWSEWVVIKYEKKLLETILGDKKEINCDNVCNPNHKDYNSELCEKAKPVCYNKLVITRADGSEEVIDGEKNENQRKLITCIKDIGCRYKISKYAMCRNKTEKYNIAEVKIRYKQVENGTTVKKLIPCGDPKNNQYMFVFYHDNSKSNLDQVITTNNLIDVSSFECDKKCTINNYYDEGNKTCNANGNNYGNYFEGHVREPNLGCIVNASETERNKYDYSKMFNVNRNLCRVYCSDRITYYIADKEKADSGRHFSYDILKNDKLKTILGRNDLSNYKITSAIEQRRDCVSEIQYNLLSNVDYKTLYGIEDNTELKTIVELYKAIIDKVKSRRNQQNSELLNSFLYDIYNCNIFSETLMNDKGVHKPYEGQYTNVSNTVKDLFNSDALFENKNGYSDQVKYGFGPLVTSFTPAVGDNPSYETPSTELLFNNARSIKKSSIDNLKNNLNDVQYSSSDLAFDAQNPFNFNGEGGKYSYGKLFNQKVDNIQYYNDFDAAYNNKLPKSRYAYFYISSNLAFYNDETYQTVNDSGNVVVIPSGSTPYNDLLTLNKYIYPVNRNAYNMQVCRISSDKKYATCDVTQHIKASPYKRVNNDDEFSQKIKNGLDFSCSVDVTPYMTKDSAKMYVRNVDPTNLFPSGYNGLGTKETNNWLKRSEIIDEVQSISNEIKHGNKTYDDILEYRITLNPEQIRNIQAYNKEANSSGRTYESQRTDNCDLNSNKKEYNNCQISFLRELRARNMQGDFSLGTYDLDYNGISKYTKEKNNKNN